MSRTRDCGTPLACQNSSLKPLHWCNVMKSTLNWHPLPLRTVSVSFVAFWNVLVQNTRSNAERCSKDNMYSLPCHHNHHVLCIDAVNFFSETGLLGTREETSMGCSNFSPQFRAHLRSFVLCFAENNRQTSGQDPDAHLLLFATQGVVPHRYGVPQVADDRLWQQALVPCIPSAGVFQVECQQHWR